MQVTPFVFAIEVTKEKKRCELEGEVPNVVTEGFEEVEVSTGNEVSRKSASE